MDVVVPLPQTSERGRGGSMVGCRQVVAASVFRGTGVETSPALKLNTIGSGSAAGWWVIDRRMLLLLLLGVGGLNLAELTLLFSAGSEVSALFFWRSSRHLNLKLFPPRFPMKGAGSYYVTVLKS